MHSTLGELVQDIASVPKGLTVYAAQSPAQLTSDSVIELLDDGADARPDLTYVLEVELIRDVIETWSQWRGGRTPSVDEAVQAVAYYADNDAYLTTE
ncbi:hypothetical protein KDL01_28970 [Actinospica durhamensis]|uniref:DUF7716 domain-containing protein n=1 Tax=Actinospica durhamensis TaxID=1508375 RepID=A0A941EU55_9ACTN|nr:hypothetical protein [Actinospica durhamensis]MBR7837346.1 hypothetical protein [Actinospica durhamensis]